MKRVLSLVALAATLIFASGCYSTQEGRLRAGVPLTKDKITSRYEAPMARIHDAAVAVLKKNGALSNDDSVTRVVRGIIDSRNVWIKFDDSEPKITKVTIQVRTPGGVADLDLASEIDKQMYGWLLTNK